MALVYIDPSKTTTYEGGLCGMCGNFNAMTDDDLHPKNSGTEGDAAQIGNSWQLGESK